VQGRLDPAEPATDDDDMGAISDTGLHKCQETVYAAGLNWESDWPDRRALSSTLRPL
jgi:hypothetical protein